MLYTASGNSLCSWLQKTSMLRLIIQRYEIACWMTYQHHTVPVDTPPLPSPLVFSHLFGRVALASPSTRPGSKTSCYRHMAHAITVTAQPTPTTPPHPLCHICLFLIGGSRIISTNKDTAFVSLCFFLPFLSARPRRPDDFEKITLDIETELI